MVKFTFIDSHPTGSRHICNPPPTDTDNDTLFLVPPESWKEIYQILTDDGWILGGSIIAGDLWCSYKKEQENYIIIFDVTLYRKWLTATEIARKFNLLNKEDRILLFKAIVDEEYKKLTIPVCL